MKKPVSKGPMLSDFAHTTFLKYKVAGDGGQIGDWLAWEVVCEAVRDSTGAPMVHSVS